MKAIIAASILAILTMSSPAFAYSNVSPRPAPHKLTSMQKSMHSFSEGREIAAPPWSFACINGQGPRQCDEPMWVYGNPGYLAQFKNAF
jgi:hypothetical protein